MSEKTIYERALYYEIAFDFRDVTAECDVLERLCKELGCGFGSFLELGCGPGDHCLEMARRRVDSHGLDLSPAMIQRLTERASERGLKVGAHCQDMRDFELDQCFHGAALLMDSAAHLLTNGDMLEHLVAVAQHLKPGGLYILEMAHPSNHFGTDSTSKNSWTMERDQLSVSVTWGQPDDPFDPITEIDLIHVHMDVEDRRDGSSKHFEEQIQSRRWLRGCFEALVDGSGCFEIVDWLGSIQPPVPFDNSKGSWRMVPVLKRLNGANGAG